MFESLLIANRGEIAARIIRTAKRMGIRTVAVYSEADADAVHVRLADEAVPIGPAQIQQSYLRGDVIIEAALARGAQAIHPGYGLLSEQPAFAQAVTDAGIVFVGPSSEIIQNMGDKLNARAFVANHGVPVARGSVNPPVTVEDALGQAQEIGYPIMLKAAAGGGGIGMSAIAGHEQLAQAFTAASTRAERVFGSSLLLLEQLITPARHIEVQILGLNNGRVLALGERDCSVQRRFQKVVEEAPASHLSPEKREALFAAAVRAGEAVCYRGAGTVEFLMSPVSGEFVFLEMNTRLQVEHPVTELVTGLDLVELQLRVAAGEQFELAVPAPRGHAIEFRLYAEDPVRMLPAPGHIEEWRFPDHDWLRVDAGYAAGSEVTPHYDPLLAKICVWGETRDQALGRAGLALSEISITPLVTNLPLLRRILSAQAFVSGSYDTNLLAGGL